MADKKKGSIVFPESVKILLTMSRKPKYNTFTRYLSFRNHFGAWKYLAAEFRRKQGLVWESRSFPQGIGALRSFAASGNRNYWDAMYLENRGGRTPLPLRHVFIEITYPSAAGDSPIGIDHRKIPIVDWGFKATLRQGRHRLSLNSVARASRRKWAGLPSSAATMVRWVAEDLGKSGSDGRDKYGRNPKYGGAISLLCSEFASWYYYQAGVKVAGKSLRDIEGAQQLHNLFAEAKRLYYYKNRDNTWRRVDNSNLASYTPKAGDYLERRGPAGAEHSMIVLRWDAARKEAIVFNGPWPVTLRRVRIDFEEKNRDKVYYVGRVSS